MPTYKYTVNDPLGQIREGTITAPTPEEAARLLREEQDCTVLKIEEQSTGTSSTAEASQQNAESKSTATPAGAGQTAALTSQLATITTGQLPLEQGLRMMAEETRFHNPLLSWRLSGRVNRLADLLEAGYPLDDAIRRAGGPADLAAIIRAGMAAGNTGKALSMYVVGTRKRLALLVQLTLGIQYPLILTTLALCLIMVFLLNIVPNFKDIFIGFGIELPSATIALISLSDILIHFKILHVLAFLFLSALVGLFIASFPSRHTRNWATYMPIWGPIVSATSMSHFAHTLAFMAENEVQLPEALRIAGDGVRDASIRKVSHLWAENLEAGQTLTAGASRIRGLPAEFLERLAGQQDSRFLARALHGLGDMYEDRARVRVATLVALTEPIVIILTCAIFLFGIFALFFPLIQLMNDLTYF